jgi:hypothetical protein
MLQSAIRIWRSHPVLTSAGIGAVLGAVNAIVLELGGFLDRHATGVRPLLFPTDNVAKMTAMQVAFLLMIEMAGSVLGFAMLFTAPVALIVGVRRLLSRSKPKRSLESEDSENQSLR